MYRYAAAVIVKIAYGHDIRSDNDNYLSWATTADHALNYGATVGITALDCLPWREYRTLQLNGDRPNSIQ
jgi:hypothetical protein